MKRLLALILSCLMIALTFASCGKVVDNSAASDSQSEATQDGTGGGSSNNQGSNNSDNSNNNSNNNSNGEKPSNPSEGDGDNKVDDDDEYKDTRQKVTFGSYPQSEVTDATLKATLNSKAGTLPTKAKPQRWTSFKHYHKYKENDVDKAERDFMWYIDIALNGEKYRGVYFTAYRPTYVLRSSTAGTSYQDDNGYMISTVYWFKYEPITWTVLDKSSANGTSLLLCDMIIDSREFDYDSLTSTPTYDNNYAKSSIRSWLNSTFLNTAFGTEEQAKILTSAVDNSIASTGHHVNPNACTNTNDKVFLLSYAEAVNDKYGLELSDFRVKKPTAYAKSQGVYVLKNGASEWWLRSPAPDPLVYDKSNMTVRGVTSTGLVDSYINANYSYRGVVPALRVKL